MQNWEEVPIFHKDKIWLWRHQNHTYTECPLTSVEYIKPHKAKHFQPAPATWTPDGSYSCPQVRMRCSPKAGSRRVWCYSSNHHTNETTLRLSFFKNVLFVYLLSALYNEWNLEPWPGREPVSPALQGRVWTTGPPGKSQDSCSVLFLHLLL